MSTELNAEHRQHLLSEGFTELMINGFVEKGLVRSLTPAEATEDWFQVRGIDGEGLTGGMVLKYSETYSQLRVDDPEKIQKPGEKLPKYLSPSREIDHNSAHIPEGCQAITEGLKDAQAFSLIGGIPTGAIAGVSHAKKALPSGCGYIIVFDADAWKNPKVFLALIKAGVHCAGKVAILPEIEDEPKAGGCEYFKAGNKAEDYKKLLDDARTPGELVDEWINKNVEKVCDVDSAAKLATTAGKAYGELYGFTSTPTKARIKMLVRSPQLKDYGLDLNAVYSDSYNTKDSQRAKNREESDECDESPIEKAIRIVKTKAVLFHSPDPDSVDYAEIPTVHNSLKTVNISSSDFKKWVRGEYYTQFGSGLTSEDMTIIVGTIKAIAAFDSPEVPVSNQRIAKFDELYYIYLADEDQTVIEYGAKGWNHCANPPIKFVFDKYKSPLPVPSKGGLIDGLWKFVRISKEDDKLLVISYLVKALVPGGTDPILALGGYQDSGKSTAAKYIRMLVDPFDKSQCLAKIPAESDSLAIHSQQRRILSFDNLSHITKDQSDFLCGIATGTGISKRKLYSDGEEILLDIQNLVLLTSIGQVIKEPDLLSRSLVIDMSRMSPDERGEDEDMAANYERLYPQMLGGLLDITCKAIEYRDSNKSNFKQYTRFGAFSLLGEGVENHLKKTTGILQKRISDGVGIAHQITIEASAVGSTIVSWLSNDNVIWIQKKGEDAKEDTHFKHSWEGNMSQLLAILKTEAKKSELASTIPKTANALGIELKKIESALSHQNIHIDHSRDYKGRHVSIKLLNMDVEYEKEKENSGIDKYSGKHMSISPDELSGETLSSLSLGNIDTPKANDNNSFSHDNDSENPCHAVVICELKDTPKNTPDTYQETDTAHDNDSDDTKNKKPGARQDKNDDSTFDQVDEV